MRLAVNKAVHEGSDGRIITLYVIEDLMRDLCLKRKLRESKELPYCQTQTAAILHLTTTKCTSIFEVG